MTPAIGYTSGGLVAVLDLDDPSFAALLTVEAALAAADAFDTHAQNPCVQALGFGRLELTGQGRSVFSYRGSPEDLALMATQLRDNARLAAECGAAGHA